jgi:hypothetical protein
MFIILFNFGDNLNHINKSINIRNRENQILKLRQLHLQNPKAADSHDVPRLILFLFPWLDFIKRSLEEPNFLLFHFLLFKAD